MEQSKIISIVGRKGVGKSVFSINLASALTQSGYDVSLVDGNYESPSLHLYLGGDVNALTLHDLDSADDVHFTDVIQVHNSGLKVIPAHFREEKKESVISSKSYSKLLNNLKDFSDVTIIDSSSSSKLMMKNISLADEVIILENNLDAKAYKQINDIIRQSKQKLKGVFLNQHEDFDAFVINQRLSHPVLDVIPHEKNLAESLYLKQPHVYLDSDSDYSKKITSVANLIVR